MRTGTLSKHMMIYPHLAYTTS
ncbi:hypothetical protein CJF32_00006103 [Rutstroemia sp. NJR-2017a WRK4]|nr:hypothetical protein CJF32_00006103 [Rutstroemia sp. NJR-2017a WRK4]